MEPQEYVCGPSLENSGIGIREAAQTLVLSSNLICATVQLCNPDHLA